ncbi:hypothetical protein K7X08_037775 [Anisodus acutangulus]|uniref:Membrane-associated kinase regulator 4 n=1 Tax=Anisodus acutangulus TaxID=402998 RepID=A0A9Q1N1J3_9SOLA|nr:hypothetical protein K7X08_037775 [Anisodus acutangulus]
MDHLDEEDYIDIEVSSCSYFSPQTREFEFKMASITNDKKTTTSHADEIFYRGRLLPLHQKLVQTDPFEEEESFCIDFLISTPSHSCRVSFEINPNDHLFEWSSTELSTTTSSSIDNSAKKVWSKKLNLITHSLITQKFTASRAFLKSLFSKSSSSYGNSCSSKNLKLSKKNFPLKNSTTNGSSSRLASITKNIDRADHSKSFSADEIKWNSPTKCLSSTNSSSNGGSFSSSNYSFNSNNGFYELNFTSELEGSIEGAVAYCKKSQELITIPTKKLSVTGLRTLTTPKTQSRN